MNVRGMSTILHAPEVPKNYSPFLFVMTRNPMYNSAQGTVYMSGGEYTNIVQ